MSVHSKRPELARFYAYFRRLSENIRTDGPTRSSFWAELQTDIKKRLEEEDARVPSA